MLKTLVARPFRSCLVAGLLALPSAAYAQSPQVLAPDATSYMALGDSIAAGYKLAPVTQGYVYRLYQQGAFAPISRTLFCNAAVPGATSRDVLLHQVPQALIPGGFSPTYFTLTVGGNDLLAILEFAATNSDPGAVFAFAQGVISQYGQNLGAILLQLRVTIPEAKIFVSNQYTVPDIEAAVPFAAQLIASFNNVVAQVTAQFPTNVYLVDVYSAFQGRNSVLLVERHGADPFESHPTALGHRVIAQAFAEVIAANK